MVEVSVVVATLKPREDVEVLNYLEQGHFENFEVVLQDETPVTKARNEGIRRAEADKVVFLDDDSRPTEKYLERAATVLESEAAYAGRTVHPRDDVFARHFTGHYDQGDSPQYVSNFWGNNMGVRREVFERVGGWDENMGWGHEEKELANRIRTEFDILYHPDLIVFHPYADSIIDYWRKTYRLESKIPYYWHKQGDTTGDQLRRIAWNLFDPLDYLCASVEGTFVKSGGKIAKTAGRLRGVYDCLRMPPRDADEYGHLATESTEGTE